MSEQKNKKTSNFKSSLIILIIGLLLVGVNLYITDGFDVNTKVELYRKLADAFTIPAILILCFGGLLFLSSLGEFDGLLYVLKSGAHFLLPFAFKEDNQRYYDYKLARSEKEHSPYLPFIYAGLILLAIALVFIVLFYQNY